MSGSERKGDTRDFTIRRARRDDLPGVLALERDGFPPASRWSEQSWRDELAGAGRTVFLAHAEQPAGVIAWSLVGELADLHRLVVAPAYRRRGLGSALVRTGLRAVQRLGARAAMLEVGYTDEPAIALYQRLGFEQLIARENYYGPDQHALILKLYDLERFDFDLDDSENDGQHLDDTHHSDLRGRSTQRSAEGVR